MSNCPICDSEYNEGQETCSTCQYPFYGDPSQAIAWGRQLWQKKEGYKKKVQTLQNKFKIEVINALEEQFKDFSERLSILEKSKPSDDTVSSRIECLQERVESIISEKEKDWSRFSEIREQIERLDSDRSRIETIKNQLDEKFKENHSITLARLDELQNKIEELEENIRANNRRNRTTGNFSREVTEYHGDVDRTSETDGPIESSASISIEETNLARRYNRDMVSFSQQATEVNATEDSLNKLRIGSISNVIFEIKRRGNYWIVSENSYDYLVPSNHLRMNQHNYKTVEDLFECINFKLDSNFQLVKPARVSPLPGGETWQLEERGILQF